MKRWQLVWLFLILGVFSGFGLRTASAHKPTFNSDGSPTPDSAFVIEDIGLSLALYGSLQRAGSVDFYRLDVPADHVIDVQLFVPLACEAYRPQLALIGPEVSGSPAPVRLELPSGMGVDAVLLILHFTTRVQLFVTRPRAELTSSLYFRRRIGPASIYWV
jgi:hypothetical protein